FELGGGEAGEALADEDVALNEHGTDAVDLQGATRRLDDDVAAHARGRQGAVIVDGEPHATLFFVEAEPAADELESDAGAVTGEAAAAAELTAVVPDLVVLHDD